MSRVDKQLEEKLLMLPRNEVAFNALKTHVEAELAEARDAFQTTANHAVFYPDRRDAALVHSGRVKALETISQLLNSLTEV